MKKLSLVFSAIALIFYATSTGCVWTSSDLSTIEKASITSETLTETYIVLHSQIKNIDESTLTDESKAVLANIKTIMNEVKLEISDYNTLVISLRALSDAGQEISTEYENNIDTSYQSIQTLITSINNKLISILE